MERPFPAYSGDAPYAFVSYAHEDADKVYPELQWLHDQGVRIWYDEGISPGSRWSEELASALDGASLLIYFSTPASVSSRHCLDEINFALDAHKPTIAVHLEETKLTPGLQLRLSSHQAILRHQLTEREYRQKLISAVTGLMDTESPAQTSVSPTEEPKRSRAAAAILAMISVLIVGAIVWWLMPAEVAPVQEHTEQTVQTSAESVVVDASEKVTDKRPSIAVLPFDNFSTSEENAFFASGIHDDILSALSKVGGLNVISRTSVTRYADSEKSLPQIAEELSAGFIMEGSVRRADNKVRIIVQLIDAARDVHVWSETYDRELEDIFAVQSEVAKSITNELKVALDVDVLDRIKSAPTHNMEAYDLYLHGRSLVLKGTSDSVQQGMLLLQQALALDPGFALAHAWMGMVYVNMSLSTVEWYRVRDVAFASARKAIELAPDEAEPNLVMGMAHYQDRDFSEALAYLDRSLSLDPNNVYALTTKSFLSMFTGDTEGAYELRKQALALNPLDAQANVLMAYSLQMLGREDDAVNYVERAIQQDPGSLTHFRASSYHWFNGDSVNTLISLYQAHLLDPDNIRYLTFIAQNLLWLGDIEAANYWLDLAESLGPNHTLYLVNRTDWLIAQGRLEEHAALVEHWLEVDPNNSAAHRHSANQMILKAIDARESEQMDLARELERQALDIMEQYTEAYRVDGRIKADVINSWGILTHAGIASRLGRGASVAELLESMETLYGSEETVAWEDFHMGVMMEYAGNRDAALDHMRKIPGSAFKAVWIMDVFEATVPDFIGGLSKDVGYQTVKDKMRKANNEALTQLRQQVPGLFKAG